MVTIGAVVLPGGNDPTVAGMTAIRRNRAGLSRAGLTILESLPVSTERVLAVLPSIVVTPAIVEHLPPEAEHRVVMLVDQAGTAVAIWGPARQLASIIERMPASLRDTPTVTLPSDVAFDVSTPRSARAAGNALLKATAKASDGWVSRHFNRPVSRAISAVLLRLGLTPTHASWLSLATGVAAAWLAAQPSWTSLVLAGAFFHLASVVDGVDGEMARVTFSESPDGARLDAIVDISTYFLCCIAFGIGWIRADPGPWGMAVAGAGVALFLVAMAHGAWFMRRFAPDASWVFIDRSVSRAARDGGRRSLAAIRFAFLLMRRDAAAAIVFLLSFTGTRTIYFVAISLAASVAILTFWIEAKPLAAAAVEERRCYLERRRHTEPGLSRAGGA
jgi:phosphatidylglycerophosphate synthase